MSQLAILQTEEDLCFLFHTTSCSLTIFHIRPSACASGRSLFPNMLSCRWGSLKNLENSTLLSILKWTDTSCVRKMLNMFCVLILFLKQWIKLHHKILVLAFHSWQETGVSAKQRRVKNMRAFLPAYLKIAYYLLNSPSTVPLNCAVIW